MLEKRIREINLKFITCQDVDFLNKFRENSKKVLDYMMKIPITKSNLEIVYLEVDNEYYLVSCTYKPA